MSVHRPPAPLGRQAGALFLVLYVAVLVALGVTGMARPEGNPLEDLYPVMLVLAGAMLGRQTLGIALGLSLTSLVVVLALSHRPLTESVALVVVCCAAAICGWGLRQWWEAATGEPPATPPAEVEVMGRAQPVVMEFSPAVEEPILNPQLALLSRRQRDVALLAAAGISSREIGRRLFISERTVETHLAKVYDKLEVHSRVELVRTLELAQRASTTDGVASA